MTPHQPDHIENEGKAEGTGKEALEDIQQRSAAVEGEHLDTRPGIEKEMDVKPIFDDDFPGCDRLRDKVAIITGGDSGIGRAVAIAYAKEGARVALVYLNEVEDSAETKRLVEAVGGAVLTFAGDVGDPAFCRQVAGQVRDRFGRIDILINNAAEQHPQDDLQGITPEQLERTFRTNIFGMVFMTQACLEHMAEGSCIINTGSITAYAGSKNLIDYSATKGAVASYTRSLAESLAEKKIRVNQVAPGPIWTPLIPSTFPEKQVAKFGEDTLLGRPGQPLELAEAYIFLAWERASSFITGQTIHINGGRFRTS